LKSFWLKTEGGKIALEPRDVPEPEPDSGQIVVRVHAAGLNRGEMIVGSVMHASEKIGGTEAAGEVVKRAREGGGPSLLECKMVRFFGHFEGDAQTYRGEGENEYNRENRDCLKLFRARVTEAGVIDAGEFDAIDAEVLAAIDQAVEQAVSAPLPEAADLTTDVYVRY